eukprot:COSAG06_NODE_192_length_20674_cov_7.209186_4_plen_852_part_00
MLGDRGWRGIGWTHGTASHVRVREDASGVIKLGPSYAAGMSKRSLDGGDSFSMRSPRAPKADFKEAARSNIQKLSEKQRDLLVQRVEKTILDALKAEARKVTGAKPVADEFCAALQEHVGCKCLAPLFAPLRPTREAPVAPRTDPVPRPLPPPTLATADAVEQYQFRAESGDVKEGEQELIGRIKTAHDEDLRKMSANLKEETSLEFSVSMTSESSPKTADNSGVDELSTSLTEMDSEFSGKLHGLTEQVDAMTQELDQYKLRAQEAEGRIGGNAQEIKNSVDTMRSTNETMKLEMEAMEKQLDLARTTQLQAKQRVVKIKKEIEESEEAIKYIEKKTKEAWRQGSGRSAASKLKQAKRDAEELANLRARTMAIRSGSVNGSVDGKETPTATASAPETAVGGESEAEVQPEAQAEPGSQPEPEPELEPEPEPELEPESELEPEAETTGQSAPEAKQALEPQPPTSTRGGANQRVSPKPLRDIDVPSNTVSESLGGLGRWGESSAAKPTPPSSRESRGSSNSSRGSSKRFEMLPRLSSTSSDAGGTSPGGHRHPKGGRRKEMKVDLGGLKSRLNELCSTGSAEDGNAPSGLDSSLDRSGSNPLSARGSFSLAGGPSLSLGRMKSIDMETKENSRNQKQPAFSAGTSFRDRVLAKKKKKTGGRGGGDESGGGGGGGGGGGSWSIIAKLESGSFSERKPAPGLESSIGSTNSNSSFSAREQRGACACCQKRSQQTTRSRHTPHHPSTKLHYAHMPCVPVAGSVAEARASARAVAAAGATSSAPDPSPRPTPRGPMPPLGALPKAGAGGAADRRGLGGIKSSSFVGWDPKGGPLVAGGGDGRRERARPAHSGRVL